MLIAGLALTFLLSFNANEANAGKSRTSKRSHTSSHSSGHYSNGSGSSHKGGHYKNSSTNNHYRKRK
jgi:hypothetical protein